MFFFLRACLSNTVLRYFFSLWFFVKDMFGKHALLIFQQCLFSYFLCFCQTDSDATILFDSFTHI
jgi:hypothetical protein